LKVLITGSEGQLGRELIKLYPDSVGTSHAPSKPSYLPVENQDAVVRFLASEKPDVVINCAALTNVDRCEKEKEYAYKINGLAVKYIAMKCSEIGAKLVHISTDYIFDGLDGNYLENAPPNPINYYGLSKLAGEHFASSANENLIVRTSGVFGHSNNFPLFVYKNLKNGEKVNAIRGFYSPIHAQNLALAVKRLIELDEKGIVNVAGERVSRMELASSIAEYFGLSKNLLNESDQVQLLQARRPFDSSLNINKAKKLIDFDFFSTKSNLEAFERSIKVAEKKI
jgi:dTDP-4-dehydrorhamnose reductase